jgi:hypothetical protein
MHVRRVIALAAQMKSTGAKCDLGSDDEEEKRRRGGRRKRRRVFSFPRSQGLIHSVIVFITISGIETRADEYYVGSKRMKGWKSKKISEKRNTLRRLMKAPGKTCVDIAARQFSD